MSVSSQPPTYNNQNLQPTYNISTPQPSYNIQTPSYNILQSYNTPPTWIPPNVEPTNGEIMKMLHQIYYIHKSL